MDLKLYILIDILSNLLNKLQKATKYRYNYTVNLCQLNNRFKFHLNITTAKQIT